MGLLDNLPTLPSTKSDGVSGTAGQVAAADMNSIITNLANVVTFLKSCNISTAAEEAWQEFGAVSSGWTKGLEPTGGHPEYPGNPQFRKGTGNMVYMRGAVVAGVGPSGLVWTAITGLPAGYRPGAAGATLAAIYYSAEDDTYYPCSILIGTNGAVQPLGGENVGLAVGDIVYLSSVSFTAGG